MKKHRGGCMNCIVKESSFRKIPVREDNVRYSSKSGGSLFGGIKRFWNELKRSAEDAKLEKEWEFHDKYGCTIEEFNRFTQLKNKGEYLYDQERWEEARECFNEVMMSF